MSAAPVRPWPRMLRLVWWAITLRLPARQRERAQARLLRDSGLFDVGYYLDRHPDVGASELDPVLHYLRCGAAEGRDPSPFFSSRFYLERNPDVAAAGWNPLVHFVRRGAREGRDPHPDIDLIFYLESHPWLRSAGLNPLLHYARVGARFGHRPSDRLTTPGSLA